MWVSITWLTYTNTPSTRIQVSRDTFNQRWLNEKCGDFIYRKMPQLTFTFTWSQHSNTCRSLKNMSLQPGLVFYCLFQTFTWIFTAGRKWRGVRPKHCSLSQSVINCGKPVNPVYFNQSSIHSPDLYKRSLDASSWRFGGSCLVLQ